MLTRLRNAKDEAEGGFTLIELLVVMIIIGILAAIAFPAFLNQKKKAKEASAKADASSISKELAAFAVDGDLATAAVSSTVLSVTYSAASGLPADSTPTKVSAGNIASVTLDAPTQVYCVTVTPPAATGASAWSAGSNGLSQGATCP